MIKLSEKKEIISPKQREVLRLLKEDRLSRINILEGSVRSGKTYISLILWGFWVAARASDCTFLMAGKTLSALKRNVLAPIQEIFGEDNFIYSLSKKEAVLFGRKIYLEGASDSRSEGKIRGMTLDGAYCDELSLFDEDFFSMLLSRLSKPNAKLIATTNPDHPRHWLKANYIDNEKLDLLDVKFTIDDNIFLDKKYVDNLKREYKGMYYERFIKGMWVAAEGSIYTDFDDSMIISEREAEERLEEFGFLFANVGVDYGGNHSASVFILTVFDRGFKNVYVLDEYYDPKNSSAEHLINAFAQRIEYWKRMYPRLTAAYCDSAEQLLIKSFRSAVNLEVKNALKRPVNTRINMLCRLMSSRRFFVSEKCRHFIDAIKTAVWDSSAFGKDVRLDDGTSDIDSMDAFEYSIERYERELFRL